MHSHPARPVRLSLVALLLAALPVACGLPALHAAARRGDDAEVAALVQQGHSVNEPDSDMRTPLMRAAGYGGLGVTLDARGDLAGSTYVPGEGHVATVRLLLDLGAKPNRKDKWGFTALHWAAKAGAADCVDVLLEHGAELDASSRWGETPLLLAADAGHDEVVRRLIVAGADVQVHESKGGNSPLMLAACGGHVEVVQTLLAARARLEDSDAQGNRPLHGAAWFGRLEVIPVLLARGASVNAPNDDGQTPCALAERRGHPEAAEALRHAGGR